jgi:hypothetical protein
MSNHFRRPLVCRLTGFPSRACARSFQSLHWSKFTYNVTSFNGVMFIYYLHSSVIKGLMFTKSNYFVNTARVDPDVLSVDGQNRLKIAGTNINAVCVMLGVVTECMLVDDGVVLSQTYPARKVTIVPFAQEMRRDTSLWGSIFNFHIVTTSVSARGLSFLSKKQGASHTANLASGPSTPYGSPQKKSVLFKSVASPLVAQSRGEGSRIGPSYQFARGFDEKGSHSRVVFSYLYLCLCCLPQSQSTMDVQGNPPSPSRTVISAGCHHGLCIKRVTEIFLMML